MMLSKAVRYLPGVCFGEWNGQACPVSARRHRYGALDAFGLIHYADRRFTRRAARRLFLLAAERERLKDPDMLNSPMFDWLYVYLDSVRAYRMAMEHGFRLPARLFDEDRKRARAMAEKRGVAVSSRPAFYLWLRGAA